MVWTIDARRFYFGETGNAIAGDGRDKLAEAIDDRDFLDHYCSDRIRATLLRETIAPSALRNAVYWLTGLIQQGDHTSPGWDYKPPLVLISKGLLQYRTASKTVTIVGRRPRLGICVHAGYLYVWADRQDVDDESGWCVWRDFKNEVQLRYEIPIETLSASTEIPVNLRTYLAAMNEKLANAKDAPSRAELLAVLQNSKDDLGHPTDFDVIYPKLTELLEPDAGGADPVAEPPVPKSGPSSPQYPKAKPAMPTGLNADPQSLPGSLLSETSMLRMLRMLAIDRVRTKIPTFDETALDRWIMSTGYPGAGNPGCDLVDLLYVFAASITNAGGRKPDFNGFANLIRDAIGLILSEGKSLSTLTINGIAEARHRQFAGKDYDLGGNFANDIAELAQGRSCRPQMALLMKSVVEFAGWLQRRYPKADNLAVAFSQEMNSAPSADCRNVFDMLNDLSGISSVGVATAANFVKDSQVPAMSAAKVSPRDAKNKTSGWFAKPDLHVMRLMVMLTGRYDRDDLRSLKGPQARALFLRPPSNEYSGAYPETDYKFSPDMRVIADIHEWAKARETSPLEIDRILYLIGVSATTVDGVEISAPYYGLLVAAIQGAIARGVSGKS